jgi:8-oxo-dGTP pyrophosphatase MutT (NUDIX family)
MHRQPLLDMLERYRTRYPDEQDVVERMLALVESRPDCFERTCRPGHITASAWVTTPSADRFVLVHHRKLDRWLQPGGHMDGDSDVTAAALREVVEETGLKHVTLAGGPESLTPFDLDIHAIPARQDASGRLIEDAHDHYDVRLLVIAKGDDALCVSDESHEVRWFSRAELLEATDEESVLRMLRKTPGAPTR